MLKATDAINEDNVFTKFLEYCLGHRKQIMAGSHLRHVFNAKQVWEVHVALNLVNRLVRGSGIETSLAMH